MYYNGCAVAFCTIACRVPGRWLLPGCRSYAPSRPAVVSGAGGWLAQVEGYAPSRPTVVFGARGWLAQVGGYAPPCPAVVSGAGGWLAQVGGYAPSRPTVVFGARGWLAQVGGYAPPRPAVRGGPPPPTPPAGALPLDPQWTLAAVGARSCMPPLLIACIGYLCAGGSCIATSLALTHTRRGMHCEQSGCAGIIYRRGPGNRHGFRGGGVGAEPPTNAQHHTWYNQRRTHPTRRLNRVGTKSSPSTTGSNRARTHCGTADGPARE